MNRVTIQAVRGGWSIFCDGQLWTVPSSDRSVFSTQEVAQHVSEEWRGTILAGTKGTR